VALSDVHVASAAEALPGSREDSQCSPEASYEIATQLSVLLLVREGAARFLGYLAIWPKLPTATSMDVCPVL
jgi:hypothetical protein